MGTNIPRPTLRPPTPPELNLSKNLPTNCPNCNAPITGGICEYCGTHFLGMDMAKEKDQTAYIVKSDKVLSSEELRAFQDSLKTFSETAYNFGILKTTR